MRIEWSEALSEKVRVWVADVTAPRVEVYKTYMPTELWLVQSVTSAGQELGRILHVPDEGDQSRVPSDGEEALLAALLYCAEAKFVELRISSDQVIAHWLSSQLSQPVTTVIAGAAGALVRDEAAHELATAKASQLDISSGFLSKPEVELKFLSEAYRLIVLAGEVRWQFLGFYRVFEHAWLRTIHSELARAFLHNPNEALKKAQEALASERMKFEETVDLLSVQSEFTDFRTEFDGLIGTNNRFCHAIQRVIERQTDAGGEWRVGVRICYQIRCAVVHSGEAGPYYESFDDADEAVLRLLVYLERAMNRIIGIEAVK